MKTFFVLLAIVQLTRAFGCTSHRQNHFFSATTSSPSFVTARKLVGTTTNVASKSPSSASSTALSMIPGGGAAAKTAMLALRGGGTVDPEMIAQAYDWCVNLGAPAALVAGAVVATLYENIRNGAMELSENDSYVTRLSKQLTNILLLSAFALQIVSIFVTTVTGTMLLSRDMSQIGPVAAVTPLAFLREKFEFEYLTSRLSFLQGLLNWLGAVALEYTIPREGQSKGARAMDKFIAVSLFTLITCMLSFYNAHMNFYSNYVHMISRWVYVVYKRYFTQMRPLMVVYLPGMIMSVITCFKALLPAKDDTAKA